MTTGDPDSGPGGASETIARLSAMVDCSADAIIAGTLTGVITAWNAGAAMMYGYPPEEMIGHNLAELIPADRAGELGLVLAEAGLGKPVQQHDTVRIRKDGSRIDVSVLARPIRGADGTVIGVSTAARDVTERNDAAAERRIMRARLHRMERMETLGQLAGGLAHDFNNLLGAIMGYAGLVAEDTADRPAVREDVEQIRAAAGRAAALTKQLLVFARREPTQPELVDLNAVVAGLGSLLSASLGSGVKLQVEGEPGLPAFEADRGQVEQVLLNLAINARDAMPEGGTLTIRAGAAVLDEEQAERQPGITPGRYVELSVRDTGVGMTREVRERAFEPFFTTKELGRGTGLGLSTVYGIVTGLGGTVSAGPAEGAERSSAPTSPPVPPR